MNKLKTIIGGLTLIAASSASAQCIVTSDQIKAMSNNEDTSKYECQVVQSTKNRKDMKFATVVDSSKAYRGADQFEVTITGQDNLEAVDLSGLDTKNDNTINLGNNKNLKEINVGQLTKFVMFNIRDTAITDLTFLENVETVGIEIGYETKITKFPSKDTPFCEGVREARGKVTLMGDLRNNFNLPIMIENCKID